jgi:large subunit ribosomal protein L25
VTVEVNVEALPMEVPQHLEVDVSGLHVNDTLRLDAVPAPEGVTLLDDPETVIATVTLPTPIEVEEPEGEAVTEETGEPTGQVAADEAEALGEADAGTGPDGEPGTVEG